MKRLILLLCFIFIAMVPSLSIAASSSSGATTEIDELKEQLNTLRDMVESLQKKIAHLETEKKASTTKLESLEEKTESLVASKMQNSEIEKKIAVLEEKEKRRITFSGESRFRLDSAIARTPEDFVYSGSRRERITDKVSWPTRARLQFKSNVIPKYLDLHGRFTFNKRFGSISYFGTSQNPHDQYNSFAAHQGSDNTMRIENLFAISKIPHLSTERLPVKLWWGRLCAYEGPPSRTPVSPFPRLFVDSEIEGGLLNFELPSLPFEERLTEIQHRFLGEPTEPTTTETEREFRKIARSGYFKKVEAKNEIYLGHIKYREMGLTGPGGKFWEDLLGIKSGPDSDCFISQAQLKMTKDTQLFFNYFYMSHYYMPRYSFWETEAHNFNWEETYADSSGNTLTIPYIKPRPYHLGGLWWDTQFHGLQIYGAHYWCHWSIAPHKHRWQFAEGYLDQHPELDLSQYTQVAANTYERYYEGGKFNGHAWFIGFNTGNLIHDKVVFWHDVTKGSKYWINPLNCKGYRRKGTVHYLTNNYFYNPGLSSDRISVGYFPFSALVMDTCLTYYLSPRCYLLLGNMYFNFGNHPENLIIGTSGRKQYWYPHVEWKIFF